MNDQEKQASDELIASLRAENATLRAAQKACEDCMTPTYAELRGELASLRAENEALLEDKALLDCLDGSPERQVIGSLNEFKQPFWIAQDRGKLCTIDCAGKSARDALRCMKNRLDRAHLAQHDSPGAGKENNP